MVKLFIILFLIYGCKPEQAATEFNVTVKPSLSGGGEYWVNKNEKSTFTYKNMEGADAGNGEIRISSRPSLGTVSCEQSIANQETKCTYQAPNKVGIDYIKFESVSGDFRSNEKGEVTIHIVDPTVPDDGKTPDTTGPAATPIFGPAEPSVTTIWMGIPQTLTVPEATITNTENTNYSITYTLPDNEFYNNSYSGQVQLNPCFIAPEQSSCTYKYLPELETEGPTYITSDESLTFKYNISAPPLSNQERVFNITAKPIPRPNTPRSFSNVEFNNKDSNGVIKSYYDLKLDPVLTIDNINLEQTGLNLKYRLKDLFNTPDRFSPDPDIAQNIAEDSTGRVTCFEDLIESEKIRIGNDLSSPEYAEYLEHLKTTCRFVPTDPSYKGRLKIHYNVVNESITYNKVSEEGYFWSQVIDGQDTTSTTSSSYPPVSVLSDTQEFTQSILTGVDFTWVIDNSSSMNSKIGKVRDNLSSFIDNIMDDGQALFPFKMHVTAGSRRVNAGLASRIKTDSSSNLTSEAAENNFESFKAKFEDIVLIDELDSNSKEAMYESAKNILVKNSLEYSADRLQVIIILTDDNEQSLSLERGAEAEIEPDAWADYWVSYFKGIGGDEVDKVRVYNIRNPEKDNNNVFTEVEEATNGKKFNILADSYEGILRDISGSVSRLLTSYKLEAGRIIISESVQVTINEAIQATTTYDLIDNSIHFKTIPEAGSAIRVSYSYTLPPAPPVE